MLYIVRRRLNEPAEVDLSNYPSYMLSVLEMIEAIPQEDVLVLLLEYEN